MTDKKIETVMEEATLWVKVKAQCLETNPFIWADPDTGLEIIQCPRCGKVRAAEDYITLSIQFSALAWSVPILKCPERGCHHLFALVR